MKNFSILVMFFLTFSFSCYCQNSKFNQDWNLYTEAKSHFDVKNYTQAQEVVSKLIRKINSKEVVLDSTRLIGVYKLSGGCYMALGNLNQADSVYRLIEQLQIQQGYAERNPMDLVLTYRVLSLISSVEENYTMALYYLKKAYENYDFISDPVFTAHLINGLSEESKKQNNYDFALQYHSLALEKYILNGGPNTEFKAAIITAIGTDYLALNQYEKAKLFFFKSLELLIELEDPYIDLISANMNLAGTCFFKMGDMDRFSDYTIIAKGLDTVDIYLKKRIQADLASCYLNAALEEQKIGNPATAVSYAFKAIDLFDELGFEEHANVLSINLGIMYFDLGFYQKTIHQLLRTEKYFLKDLEKSQNHLQSIYHYLGMSYNKLENFEKAIDYCNKSIHVTKNIYGENSLEIANSYNSLASVLLQNNDYENATSYLAKAYKILSTSLSKTNDLILSSVYNNFGILSLYQKDYKKAKIFLKKSYEIKSLLAEEKDNLVVYQNLCLAYKGINEFDSAFYFSRKYCKIMYNSIQSNFQHLTFNDREKFYYENLWMIDDYFIFLSASTKTRKTDFYVEGYNYLLSLENLLFQFDQDFIYSVKDTTNFVYKQYFNSKAKLYNLNILSTKLLSDTTYTDFDELVYVLKQRDSLERQLPVLESKFLEYYYPNSGQISTTNITWGNIVGNLKQNEVVIDFQNFKSSQNDSVSFYGAFILDKNSPSPLFFKLFNESELLQFYDNIDSPNLLTKIRNMYSDNYSENFLYKTLWEPLDGYLKGKNIIYLSTSGILNNISIPSLPIAGDSILSERYQIHYISSPVQLLQADTKNSTISQSDSIALFYNVSYNTSNDMADTTSHLTHTLGGIECPVESWKQLDEFDLGSMVKRNIHNTSNTFSFTRSNASKSNFLKFHRHSPDIIQFFTHAYYCSFDFPSNSFEKGGFAAYKHMPDPMYRSGLILSGGNIGWQQTSNVGVLTSYEIQQLDLSNTKLVILSACVTGLGDFKQYEGTYGLQRAFKMSGVANIIMTLWPVYDKYTIQFFEHFYNELGQKKSIHNAFYDSQHKMRTLYPERPAIWAGFVLLE